MPPKKPSGPIPVDAITHADKRANLPTADAHDFVSPEVEQPRPVRYPRDPSLDPQLVWKGKDELDGEDLVADAPPIYIQEKIDPRVLIENLRRTAARPEDEPELTLFKSFDGLGELELVDFYRHQANWSNRMILGDSLNVMASLTEREALRGKVQMVYLDPPYGIKFGSNWQSSARRRGVKDGNLADATREVEQIKAFRDTWELGIHSYLAYLRDRLTAARDLLTESGSVFVQIGDENVHLVRALMDEVFGSENFLSLIAITKSGGGLESKNRVPSRLDYLIWYANNGSAAKYRPLFEDRADLLAGGFSQLMLPGGDIRAMTRNERDGIDPLPPEARVFRTESLTKPGPGSKYTVHWEGHKYTSGNRWWGTTPEALDKLLKIGRVRRFGNTLRYMRFADDFPSNRLSNLWDGIGGAVDPIYVVQTSTKIVERCMLMTTDPGDLVLDPTCGSATTAAVAEQWGRRWITIDTSRVALALARQRLMASRFPYYLLSDSTAGRAREAELTGTVLPEVPVTDDVRRGFVYERQQRITMAGIANNPDVQPGMSHDEVDAAIRKHAEFELRFDKAFEDARKVRVAGPFTVESLSPHRSLGFAGSAIDESGALNRGDVADPGHGDASFEQSILANLKAAGVQNGRRNERLQLDDVEVFAGAYIQAVGVRDEDAADSGPRRVALAVGPQYGTVGPAFVKAAAREAIADPNFDLLCVLAFAFDPQVVGADTEYAASADGFAEVAAERRLGRIPVLLVRMNADLVMGDNLKKTGAGNLFTVFGEPDVAVETTGDLVTVELRGVDVYDPNTGEIRSNDTEQVALWMIDSNYDGESFFVRHCYFTGGQDPYDRLRKALNTDVDEDAWSQLASTRSRPFPRPSTGRIAVKVINDYGDEVLKVFDLVD